MAARRGIRVKNSGSKEEDPTQRHTSAAPPPSILNESDEDDEDWGDEDDDTLAHLNDPNVANLGPTPMLGGGMSRVADLFGNEAITIGRATSPKLYAQASQFPTCSQLRVWRWENGIPVGLGAIDAQATEEDMVREFFEAMPKPGSGRMQFKLRPIDIRGEEMGKEITLVISEHHSALQQIRRARKAEAEEAAMPTGGMGMQMQQPLIYDRGGDDGGAAAGMAGEMARMFEKAVEASDQRANALEQALMEERERLRSEGDTRAQERIDLATNAAAGVQAITERMMRDEANRAERAMKSQTDQSQMLLTTLTQIFASAQSQQHSISETARMADQQRLEQERQYAERIRGEQEERRKRDLQEMEERRKGEQNRLEDERKQMKDQRDYEMRQLEARLSRDREEALTRADRERQEGLNSLTLAERKLERERQEQELKASRDKDEQERRYQREREEQDRKAAREKEEYNLKIERERLEWQNRWKLESEERERRDRTEREERERKSKLEQEMMIFRQQEMERRMSADAELQRQRDAERQRAHEMGVKQMEMAANRDREHAERMLQMARLEMENQRQSADVRIRSEKEDQERREQDRLRQHERLLKEAELQSQKDREHAERMMQLTQMQMQNKAFGGLGELLPKAKELLGTLGIDPADIIDRLINPPAPEPASGGGGSAWADAIPKVLGSLAEMGKVALEAKAKQNMPLPRQQVPMMMPQMMPGMMPYMGSPMPGMPGIPNLAAQNQMLAMGQAEEAEEQDGRFSDMVEQSPEEEEGGEMPAPAEEETPAPPAEPEPPSTVQSATEAGLSLPTQKRARKAIRTLIRKLSSSKAEDWTGIIATAISNEIGIYHYVKAVTVRSALKEAGADDELCDRVCDAMKESGMVPDDVPYD